MEDTDWRLVICSKCERTFRTSENIFCRYIDCAFLFNDKENEETIKDLKMKINVHLLSQSHPIEYVDITNAYTKDGMYCIYKGDEVVKYPLCNIFRVKESYK